MQVHRSGYYQWLNQPISNRELENQELLIHIKESKGVYGHRNIHKDLMAVSKVKQDDKVILYSNQGSQYSSYDYKKFAKKHNIILSMSRRGNCYDCVLNEVRKCPWGAVAESFFKTIKKELVRKQIFETREIAASKIFEYIEMFYNPKRRHSYLDGISPNEFEKRYNLESLNK